MSNSPSIDTNTRKLMTRWPTSDQKFQMDLDVQEQMFFQLNYIPFHSAADS